MSIPFKGIRIGVPWRVICILVMLDFASNATSVTIPFSSGPPSLPLLQVTPLNGGVLDYSGGKLTVTTTVEGDADQH